jgi:hypothetical protein
MVPFFRKKNPRALSMVRPWPRAKFEQGADSLAERTRELEIAYASTRIRPQNQFSKRARSARSASAAWLPFPMMRFEWFFPSRAGASISPCMCWWIFFFFFSFQFFSISSKYYINVQDMRITCHKKVCTSIFLVKNYLHNSLLGKVMCITHR